MKALVHGGDVYAHPCQCDFSVNVNPLGPPPGVIRAVEESVNGLDRYPDVRCRALRAALAKEENVQEEQLLFGNGASELIYALAHGLRPEKTLLLSPTFSEYEAAVTGAGGEVETYDLLPERGFRVGADFPDAISPGTGMVILCNPNNPTGVVTGRDLLLAIAKRCEQRGVYLVIDECFAGLLPRPEEVTLQDVLPEFPHLILLRAFTKTYAMPALRLGYLVSANREVLSLLERQLPPWNVSSAAQAAGEAALLEREYLRRARQLIREEREVLVRGLRALGYRVWDSEANYLLFLGAPGLDKKLEQRGILIRNCGNYRGLREGYYRIAVRRPEENRALLAVLHEF